MDIIINYSEGNTLLSWASLIVSVVAASFAFYSLFKTFFKKPKIKITTIVKFNVDLYSNPKSFYFEIVFSNIGAQTGIINDVALILDNQYKLFPNLYTFYPIIIEQHNNSMRKLQFIKNSLLDIDLSEYRNGVHNYKILAKIEGENDWKVMTNGQFINNRLDKIDLRKEKREEILL